MIKSPSYSELVRKCIPKTAKRLAEILNKKAYVLCSIKSFEVNKFTVKDCRPTQGDDLPF